jgi:hypothetical protein
MSNAGETMLEYAVLCFYISLTFDSLLWPDDRNTPKSTEKVPINLADMLELLKLMANFIATTKGQNFQNSC